VPGYAPCPRQGICITYSLLLVLPRYHLCVGGMFSRYSQQPILVDSVFLIVPFALHHYTYLIEGADFPIDQNLHRNPYGCLSNEIKVTWSERELCQSFAQIAVSAVQQLSKGTFYTVIGAELQISLACRCFR
jgi:hypothetical protein